MDSIKMRRFKVSTSYHALRPTNTPSLESSLEEQSPFTDAFFVWTAAL